MTKNKYETAKDKGGPNGAEILDEVKVEPHLSVVLARHKDEYICWMFNHQTGGFFWGHYNQKEAPPRSHLALEKAVKTYAEREEHYYRTPVKA